MKNRNHFGRGALFIAGAFLLLGFAACNRNTSGGDVMASINGRKIYRSEVDKYYANQTAGSDQQPVGEQAVSLRLSILNFVHVPDDGPVYPYRERRHLPREQPAQLAV